MQVKLEVLKDLERKMHIAVPLSAVNEKIAARLQQLAFKAKIPGFRPGKAPLAMVAKKYHDTAHQEAIKEVIKNSFDQALVEQKLRVVGLPAFEINGQPQEKDTFAFDATFEVYPEVVIKDLSKQKLEKPTLAVTDQDVKKTIEVLRKQHTQFIEVKRAAQKGDRVIIDFEGKIDDKLFEGGQAKDFSLVLGQGTTLPEFELSLLGAKKDSTCVAVVPFPKDYHKDSLAGKTAEFTITLKAIAKPQLPKIDANFAELLGVSEGVDKLEAVIGNHLNQEVERRLHLKTKENIVNMLLKAVPVQLPTYLVKKEVARLSQEAQSNMAKHTEQNTQLPDKMFQKSAERNVALNIIFGEIIQSNQLKASADATLAVVKGIAEAYENKQKIIDWYYEDRERLSGAIALVLEDEVIKWVLSQVKVIEKAVSFDEVMGTAKPSRW